MLVHPPLKFSRATVLCVGDVMLDHFVYGQVERISPESPIPILHQQHQFSMLGGAGNVIRNITALGGHVVFVSVLGHDHAGHVVEQQLQSLNTVQAHLFKENNRQTIQKTRFIAQGQQLLRVDEEAILPVAPQIEAEIINCVEHFLPTCQAVILSDYHKGLFNKNLSLNLIQRIRLQAAHIPIIVDPKGRHYQRYQGATILTPNLKELSEVIGHPLNTQPQIVQESRRLKGELNIESLLVTQGSQGMTLIEKDAEPCSFAAKAREVYDVSGAGDTVVATLALALATDYSLKEGCYLANEAAGIVVGKVGTATITQTELENSLNQHHPIHHSQKIMTLSQVQDSVKRWRYQGLKIGFTNGCFDLLHLGHLHILQEAAKKCDKLVVGLNTDLSIKCLKGDNRPIQNQETRAMVLAALSMVDAVILFEAETPIELIKGIHPDVLIKGADYTLDRVVGGDFVQARGGQVVLVDLQQGHSTTNTVTKIRAIG